ncbi:hypothetical protein Tsubulata_018094 [Turnera subulata]|uniref:RRM domain-containing protein n=1 Tax=Turnera subulata TaxID=218843 RepID=A0A9Q0J704_9ROSI|nr:hypothetical protein Tsubulata_018094 [Turnera subulata]
MLMNRFGEVMDVFMPGRLSKSAKRYAFVRFKQDGDVQKLIHDINRMHDVSAEIFASVARSRQNSNRKRREPRNMNRPQPFASTVVASQTDNRSFAEESPVVSIILLGGVSFLFKFKTIKDRDDMVEDKPLWFNQCFEVFKPWENSDGAYDRLCWVLVKGVPPCAWSKNFFQLVVSRVVTSVNFGSKKFLVGITESQYNPLDWSWSTAHNGSEKDDGSVGGRMVVSLSPSSYHRIDD